MACTQVSFRDWGEKSQKASCHENYLVCVFQKRTVENHYYKKQRVNDSFSAKERQTQDHVSEKASTLWYIILLFNQRQFGAENNF